MSSNEVQKNFEDLEGVALGDMPNLEGLNDPEVMSALANIDGAIQGVDKTGQERYGAENWDLINAK